MCVYTIEFRSAVNVIMCSGPKGEHSNRSGKVPRPWIPFGPPFPNI